MSDKVFNGMLLLSLVFIIGCTEVAKDDPRFEVNPVLEKTVITQGYNIPDAGELWFRHCHHCDEQWRSGRSQNLRQYG